MTDTGSTNFPQGPRFDRGSNNASTKTVFNASLIGIPNANKGAANKIQNLKGQVIQQNDKGQVRIQTEKGIVEIQLPKDSPQRQQPLQEGQRVNIEIPPQNVRERNPETVRIQIDAGADRTIRKQTGEQIQTPPPQEPRSEAALTKPKDEIQTRLPDQALPSKIITNTQQVSKDASIQTLEKMPDLQSLANLPQKPTITLSQLTGETIRLDPLPPSLTSQILIVEPQVSTQTINSSAFQSSIAVTTAPNAPITNAQFTTSPKPIEQQHSPQPEIANIVSNQTLTIDKADTTINVIQTKTVNAQTLIPEQNTLIPFKSIAPQVIAIKEFSTALTSSNSNNAIQTSSFFKSEPITAKIQNVIAPLPILVAPNQIPQEASKLSDRTIELPAKDTIQTKILETVPFNVQSAIVIGTTPNSLPIVSISSFADTPPQNFILQVPVQDISTGQRLEIITQQSLATTIQASSITAAQLPTASYFTIPGQWPLMEDIQQNLAQISTSVAQAMTASIPNASSPAQITPAALFFIAAIRAGDLSQILGDRAQNILKSQGKGGLLSRLTQEGNIISRAEQPSGEWRSLTLPMAWQNEIQKIALHYKHDYPNENEDDKGSKQTRFIFDLSLSRMGKVQLDGFHKDNTLNMIIRTESPTSQSMQMAMKRLYHEALDETALSGELAFQNALDSWVTVNQEDQSEFLSDI